MLTLMDWKSIQTVSLPLTECMLGWTPDDLSILQIVFFFYNTQCYHVFLYMSGQQIIFCGIYTKMSWYTVNYTLYEIKFNK